MCTTFSPLLKCLCVAISRHSLCPSSSEWDDICWCFHFLAVPLKYQLSHKKKKSFSEGRQEYHDDEKVTSARLWCFARLGSVRWMKSRVNSDRKKKRLSCGLCRKSFGPFSRISLSWVHSLNVFTSSPSRHLLFLIFIRTQTKRQQRFVSYFLTWVSTKINYDHRRCDDALFCCTCKF